jgi:hypothetical protein
MTTTPFTMDTVWAFVAGFTKARFIFVSAIIGILISLVGSPFDFAWLLEAGFWQGYIPYMFLGRFLGSAVSGALCGWWAYSHATKRMMLRQSERK